VSLKAVRRAASGVVAGEFEVGRGQTDFFYAQACAVRIQSVWAGAGAARMAMAMSADENLERFFIIDGVLFLEMDSSGACWNLTQRLKPLHSQA